MTSGLKWRLLDVGFATTLLLLAAVPLVLLRGNPVWGQSAPLIGLATLFAVTLALWAILLRRDAGAAPAAPGDRPAWWHTALVAGLLGAITLIGFYAPLRLYYWGGADDFLNLMDTPLVPWVVEWDQTMNRPFTVLPSVIGRTLTPNRIEGFLRLGVGLCWLNGLLLFVLLRALLPQARVLSVVAAMLLIVDPADPARFLVMWASNYYQFALAALLAAACFFLWSYRRGSRPLLVLACVLLGTSLLTNEGGYPLALLVPVLAWFHKDHRRRLPAWACAWVGTLALLATRFLIFLAQQGTDAYQARQSGEAFRNPRLLWRGLRLHLEPGLHNFRTTGAVLDHWKTAVAILALATALVFLVSRRGVQGETPRRQYVSALGFAGLAVLLGITPFLSMPFVFRTQFFSAPGQAAALACGLCLFGSLWGRRMGVAVVAACVGLLTANASAEALAEQVRQREQSPVSFVRMVRVFRQIHARCPNPPPGTLMLLYLDDTNRSPWLCNFCCVFVSRHTLGVCVVPVNPADPAAPLMAPVFHADGITLQQGKKLPFPGKAPYDRVLAFRLAADDTVTLMDRLPPELLPPAHTANRYQPLALMRPSLVARLPYLRYPRWENRPRDGCLGAPLGFGRVPVGFACATAWPPLSDHAQGGAGGAAKQCRPPGARHCLAACEVLPEPAQPPQAAKQWHTLSTNRQEPQALP